MKRNKAQWRCYKCGKQANSKEHVPPLCLFPEEKDIKTSIFRNNLITVPSCDLHNSKKSKDDEFLMAVLAGIVGNNIIGFFHNKTKVKRALERKGISSILDPLNAFEKSNILQVKVDQGNFERLKTCFEHIAYGLYLHKFVNIFIGECRIILDFLSYGDPIMENYKILCRKRWEHEPTIPLNEGDNQEIFRYAFVEPDEQGLIALRLSFYEGAHVYIAFIPEGSAPPTNFAEEFIKSGIKTIIKFPDESVVEFN